MRYLVILFAVSLAGCDSENSSQLPQEIERNSEVRSILGRAALGIITGYSLELRDSRGTQLAPVDYTAVINPDGTYNVEIDADAVDAYLPPIVVSLLGSGASATCDYINPDGSGNDCRAPNNDGVDFVSFGEQVLLSDDFVLESASASGDSLTITTNLSPASNLVFREAQQLAGGTGLVFEANELTQANEAVVGLLELITGIDFGDDIPDLTRVPVLDLTEDPLDNESTATLVVNAFGASVFAMQSGTGQVEDVLEQLANQIQINAKGQPNVSGVVLANLARALSNSISVVAGRLNGGSSAAQTLASAATTANSNVRVFTSIGIRIVTVPRAAGSAADDLALTSDFVGTLGRIIGLLVGVTGAEGFGGDEFVGSTEALANELDAVRLTSSTEATRALSQLLDAIDSVIAQIESAEQTIVFSDNGVTFELSQESEDSYTISNITSRWPVTGDTGVVVTISSSGGTISGGGGDLFDRNVNLADVTMVTTNAGATLQTFNGFFSNERSSSGSSVSFNGQIQGAAADSAFTVNLVFNLDTDGDLTGDYAATFAYSSASDDVTIRFNGPASSLGGGDGQTAYGITANGDSLSGLSQRTNGLESLALSDGPVTLSLSLRDGQVLVEAGTDNIIGRFSVGTGDSPVETAVLDSTGVVTLSDGSIQLLPAIIF